VPNPAHPYFQLSESCRKHNATLVAVSKMRDTDAIENLYQMGQRIFAENRVQELLEKAPALPGDIIWHLIGHLQTNKVKAVLPYVSCIQSLDRLNLWEKINAEAEKMNRTVNCLLQVKIATEETKYGWNPADLYEVLKTGINKKFPGVQVTGVMGMASLTGDTVQVRSEMKNLKSIFETLRAKYFNDTPAFKTISMGMSGDYQIALEEGSTMIRVGSLLFP
jgi:PLP dependent protein